MNTLLRYFHMTKMLYVVLSLNVCFMYSMETDDLNNEKRFKQLPSGVTCYLGKLPKINRVHDQNDRAHTIVEFMKLFSDSNGFCTSGAIGQEKFEEKVRRYMKDQKPIEFILVGFPCKSKNNDKKTLSNEVDLGELVALLTLNYMNDQIKYVYTPGIHIQICSDPFISQLNQVCKKYGCDFIDEGSLRAYRKTMQSLVALFHPVLELAPNEKLESIYKNSYKDKDVEVNVNDLENYKIFVQEDMNYEECNRAFEKKLFENNRDSLVETFKKESNRLRKRQAELVEKLPTISFEDLVKYPFYKKTIREKLKIKEFKRKLTADVALEIAKNVIRTRALLQENIEGYDELIRLSIHPVANSDISKKLGIALVPTFNNSSGGTPWHNTPMVTDNCFELLSRKQTIDKGKVEYYMLGNHKLGYIDATSGM